MTRYNDMTPQEQALTASNLLAVAQHTSSVRYVLKVIDKPHKLYTTEQDDSVHLDEDLSHTYLVNVLTDELMSAEALGFHDVVIVYQQNHGYTIMPGRYS